MTAPEPKRPAVLVADAHRLKQVIAAAGYLSDELHHEKQRDIVVSLIDVAEQLAEELTADIDRLKR